MRLGFFQIRLLGVLLIGVSCSFIACSGGGGASAAPTAPASSSVAQAYAVELTPSSAQVGSADQVSLTAQVKGGQDARVLWSVDGVVGGNADLGTIVGTGNSVIYVPSVLSGSHTVSAVSVADPTKTASCVIAVIGLPARPLILAPSEVKAGTGPHTASITLVPGQKVQWSIVGGTLRSPSTGASVQFDAGLDPLVRVGCTVTNELGATAGAEAQVISLPFVPRNYLADFKANLATYRTALEGEIATGDSQVYYFTSYYLHGMAAAAEASGDTDIMDELLRDIGLMMAQAHPLVRNGATFQEWGPWDTNGNPWQLYTFQAASPLARTAAVIAGRPDFKARYGAQADRIVAFVDQAIFSYWFDKTAGVYKDPTSSRLAGQIPWLSADLGGWGTYPMWSDKCSHLGTIAAWMYQATRKPLYLEIATRVGQGFRTHLKESSGRWIWDGGIVPILAADNLEGVPDTSHANREPMMMVAMYEAGIVFGASDVDRMARTLLDALWNQQVDDPMFSNYINGSNKPYGLLDLPGQNGLVYGGWASLGRASAEAQRVLACAYQAIQTRSPRNACLDRNATSYGLVELSGTLARNASR